MSTDKQYRLNAKQLHILKLIYKFRFITAPLLTKYKGLKSRHAVYTSLEILKERGYLDKRINTNETFKNKGARYHLTTDSLKLLKNEHGLNERVLSVIYKNQSVSEGHVDHIINVIKVYLQLNQTYPAQFDIFTATELLAFDSFPEPKPDLFLNRLKPKTGLTNHYMLDVLKDTQPFILKKRIQAFIEHYEVGDWDEDDYPTILLVCPNARIEEQLEKHIASVLESTGIDDEITFLLTTYKAVMDNQAVLAVWTDPIMPEKLVAL